jgi:hypothetical protein
MIYLIGSLRNPDVPKVAASLRATGIEVFDDWYAAGYEADDMWKEYEQERGRGYLEALEGHAANHVFSFDKRYLDRADAGVLVAPAGKSGHLELGYLIGRGRRGYYLLDDPERWDVMLKFCTRVTTDVQGIIADYQAHSGEGLSGPGVGTSDADDYYLPIIGRRWSDRG